MSIADLLAQATPQAQYYDYDRKIMEDYDNRAKIYNEAYDKYKKDFEDYQKKVDDFNLLVDQYNTNLADPAFTGTAPVFKGGAEPTAPVDPGFSQGDIDAFIDEATARATRRGQTAATAFNVFQQGGNFATAPQVQGGAGVSTQPEFSFSGSGFADGGVVSPPDDPPVVAPARNEGALGLGYFIPSGLKEFFRRPKERDRGPINAPGFENINFLLRGINFPYNIVAGAGGKTSEAFDPDLPKEERIRAGGEAAIETGIQALLPVAGRMAGQPLSRAIVESFFPVSTPKSAAEVAVDTVEDMGRRNMLKGAAATTGIAALAPEVFIEASKKVPAAVTKTAAKAATINPINMAAENIMILKKQIDEADALRDEIIDQVGEGAEASAQQATIYNTQDEIFDVVRDTLDEFEPEDYIQASDEALEELAKYNYDLGNLYGGADYYAIDVSDFQNLANEAKRRGLHIQKSEKGITQFPNISALVEELDEKALGFENGGAVGDFFDSRLNFARSYGVEPVTDINTNLTFKDAAKTVAEFTPIIGDAMAAKEVYDELTKEDPNYKLIAALGGAALIGAVPGIGDAAAAGIRKAADVARRIEVDPNALGSMGGNIRIKPSTEDLASEYLARTEKTLKLQKIDRVIADGKVDNLDADEINRNVLSVASREGIPFPKRAFDDENVQYVSTSLINQTIPRANPPRYNVGEFFPIEDGVGKIAPATDVDVKKFLESEKRSLKEEIFSEGIKKPIEIKVSKKTGEAHIGDGHHRLDAALELGIEEVPIIVKVSDNELLRKFMTPIKVNTQGLEVGPFGSAKSYSFDKINFLQRIERPRPPLNKPGEFAYDEFDRPLSLYGDAARGGIDTIPTNLIKPMRPGMYRIRNVDKEYLSEAERELLRNSPDVPLLDKSKYADGGVVSFAPLLR